MTTFFISAHRFGVASALCISLSLFAGCTGRDLGGDTESESAAEGDGDSASSATSAGSTSGSSSTTDDSTSATESSTDSGTNFVSADMPMGCDGQAYCDIWNPNCGEGEKCSLRACNEDAFYWEEFACVPILGDDPVGADCSVSGDLWSGEDSCGDRSVCMFVDPDTKQGTCVAFCEGDPSSAVECPPSSACKIAGNGTPAACFPFCDPLAQECEEGYMCLQRYDGFFCEVDASEGTHPYGSPCEYVNECNPGLACVPAGLVPDPACTGSENCCSPYCDLTQPNTCPGQGQVCIDIWAPETPPEGLENFGVCAVP